MPQHRPRLGVGGPLRIMGADGHQAGIGTCCRLVLSVGKGCVICICFCCAQRGHTTKANDAANRKPRAITRKPTPPVKSRRHAHVAGGQAAIGQGDAGKAIGHVRHHAQANERAPVLAKQSHIAQVQLGHPCAHPSHLMGITVVLGPGRLVRAAKAHQIGHHHPATGLHQGWDHFSVQLRPRGLAVQQQHQGPCTRTFVDVGHAQATHRAVVRCVGKVTQAFKAMIGRSQNLCRGGGQGWRGKAHKRLPHVMVVLPAGKETKSPSIPT